jgi:hypothetical protein
MEVDGADSVKLKAGTRAGLRARFHCMVQLELPIQDILTIPTNYLVNPVSSSG